jgi:UDP-GlcNAc3NAcA epimerase
MVATDSGGVQKEAYFFHKPCITLRDETEWIELVQAGYNKLVGAAENQILAAYAEFRNQRPTFKENFYGTGSAGEYIANHLKKFLEKGDL